MEGGRDLGALRSGFSHSLLDDEKAEEEVKAGVFKQLRRMGRALGI